MAEIVSFPGSVVPNGLPTEKTHFDIIDLLERYLERARCGEFRGILIGMVQNDGSIGSEWVCSDGVLSLAAASYLQHRVAHSMNND